MTSLEQFNKILDTIHKLELVPSDLQTDGDYNKPRVRAELAKLDIHVTEDGLGDYMLGVLSEYYLDYPDWPTPEHKEQALEHFQEAMAKGYAAAGERAERLLKEKAENAERARKREEDRIKWKTDNPFFPWQQEFEKKPAGDWKIEEMSGKCKEELGVEPPDGYIAFARTKDGFKSRGREIFEPYYTVEHNKGVLGIYGSLAERGAYWKEREAAEQTRYFFVGKSGGGYSEWNVERNQYVELPWKNYYAYDYETKRYARVNAETGDAEESYATFTEMFKAIWSGVIAEEDYREKLPEVENWNC